MSSNDLETRLSINPFDDGSGSFLVFDDEGQHETMGDRK